MTHICHTKNNFLPNNNETENSILKLTFLNSVGLLLKIEIQYSLPNFTFDIERNELSFTEMQT